MFYAAIVCGSRTQVPASTGSWWSGVVVSALALINEVNLCRAWLVLRWATVSVFSYWWHHLFWYVTNQRPSANSVFYPLGVGK